MPEVVVVEVPVAAGVAVLLCSAGLGAPNMPKAGVVLPAPAAVAAVGFVANEADVDPKPPKRLPVPPVLAPLPNRPPPLGAVVVVAGVVPDVFPKRLLVADGAVEPKMLVLPDAGAVPPNAEPVLGGAVAPPPKMLFVPVDGAAVFVAPPPKRGLAVELPVFVLFPNKLVDWPVGLEPPPNRFEEPVVGIDFDCHR